ncbi:DUF6080 domain-containing protein [Paenibacillus sp. FSL R7-0204]|uniref:DUF6080 domain-containing protein n=1 Tax=Paenibacillus sp. FSL R7-0204 TaxID=2921675 RepID=UPI0030FA6BB0
MSFYTYYFKDKKDNYIAAAVGLVLFLGYLLINMPYIQYIKENADMLSVFNPFYGAPFSLNLFNFDPSVEYGSLTSSIIHPLYNFLTAPLNYLSVHSVGNLFFLLLQSILNALGTAILFFIMRKSGSSRGISAFFSILFGVCSYTLFSSLIPDSYPYAQLIMILSAAYLYKSRDLSSFPVIPGALLILLNFGITSTNLITFTGALFVSIYNSSYRMETLKRFLRIMIFSLLLLIFFTGLQYALFSGKTWVSNVGGGLSNGAFGYISPFSLAHHSELFHMLVVNPVLTPEISLIDPKIVAFASNISAPHPIYVQFAGFGITVLAILGFIRGIRNREVWSLMIYPLFAIFLHIVIGFGLAAYKYDLYLYAGHYLFAIFLLASFFVRTVTNVKLKKVCSSFIILLIIVTMANNIVKHYSTLDYIKSSYIKLENQSD